MFKLFTDVKMNVFLSGILRKAEEKVNLVSVGDLNVYPVERLSENIASTFTINPLVVDVLGVNKETKLNSVQGKYFPPERVVDRHKNYECVLVEYSYPVSGSIELLSVQPTTKTLQPVSADVANRKLIIPYQTYEMNIPLTDAEKTSVRSYFHPIHEQLQTLVDAINKDIEDFKAELLKYISTSIEDRKSSLGKKESHDRDL